MISLIAGVRVDKAGLLSKLKKRVSDQAGVDAKTITDDGLTTRVGDTVDLARLDWFAFVYYVP